MTRALPKGWRRDRLKDVAPATGSSGVLEVDGKRLNSETPSSESKRSVSAASSKSEFHTLPQGWRRVKLKHTGTFDNGLTYSPSDIVESDGILVLRSSNIKDGKLAFDDNVYVKDAPASLRVKKGDIIICSRNGSVNLVGKCAVVDHDIQSVFGAFMMRYRPKIHARYAFYMFQCVVAKYKGMYATSTVNQITLAILSRMNTIIPPLPEQKRIAAFLEVKCADIDKAIAAKQKQLDCIDEMWKNILYKATTQGLDAVGMERTNNVLFPKVPCGWKIKRLKRICSMRSGDNLGAADIFPDGDYPVYGGNGLRGFYSDFNVSGKFILVGRQGALCGNVHLVEGKFWATEHALITTLYPNMEVRFVAYMMGAMNLNQYASQSAAQPGLAASKILNVETVVPPYSEQCEIANYLDAKRKNLDELKDNLRRQIEVLEQYRKSLIHECVMGERRVG